VRYSCNTGGRPLFDTRPTVARLTAHEEAAQSGGVVGWILHHPDRSLFRKVLRRGRSEEPETPLKMYCTWSVRPRVMRHRVAASSSSCTMASSSSSTTRAFALGVIIHSAVDYDGAREVDEAHRTYCGRVSIFSHSSDEMQANWSSKQRERRPCNSGPQDDRSMTSCANCFPLPRCCID
jgi:hypothetical protein